MAHCCFAAGVSSCSEFLITKQNNGKKKETITLGQLFPKTGGYFTPTKVLLRDNQSHPDLLQRIKECELFDEVGDRICTLGHEFGSVTGRKRRCGWIDLVALKYAIMVDRVTKLIMMKSDVLDTFETIKACVAYNINGEEVDFFPYDINEGVEPVYVELPGWQTDMTKLS